ncbi:hypothetical protein [Mucilaginibacter pedocola]|nr:hypothetical protein [Mucilaginibacter pedocola]
MKTPALLLLILAIAACESTPKNNTVEQKIAPKPDTLVSKATPAQPKTSTADSALYADTTRVNISTMPEEPLFSTKGNIAWALKYHPELNEEYMDPPYTAYAKRNMKVQKDHIDDFGSEAGQDSYFTLYAYFLSLKNGQEKYRQRRDKLMKLYMDLVSTFIKMENGGSIPNHNYLRAMGVAEYSIQLYANDGDWGRYKKKYDISKQKALYIRSLKQYIIDECYKNNEVLESEKQEMLKIVSEINSLITDYFYLERAMAFQYSD